MSVSNFTVNTYLSVLAVILLWINLFHKISLMFTSETATVSFIIADVNQVKVLKYLFITSLFLLLVRQKGQDRNNDRLCKKYFNFLLRLLLIFTVCSLEQTQ